MQPAIALLEFDSIAMGIRAGDAMVKRAQLRTAHAGTVHPGKYLVLVGGDVGDVEEAMEAGLAVAGESLVDSMLLPDVHPEVVAAVGGARLASEGEALGIIETRTVAAVIEAADAGVKGAQVTLGEIRMADGLGGKGYVLFYGPVAEAEAAVLIGSARIEDDGQLISRVVIPQIHPEMLDNLLADPRFVGRAQAGPEG